LPGELMQSVLRRFEQVSPQRMEQQGSSNPA
jgi:hypothetical protein